MDKLEEMIQCRKDLDELLLATCSRESSVDVRMKQVEVFQKQLEDAVDFKDFLSKTQELHIPMQWADEQMEFERKEICYLSEDEGKEKVPIYNNNSIEINHHLVSTNAMNYKTTLHELEKHFNKNKTLINLFPLSLMKKTQLELFHQILQQSNRKRNEVNTLQILHLLFRPQKLNKLETAHENVPVQVKLEVGKWGKFWGLGIKIQSKVIVQVQDLTIPTYYHYHFYPKITTLSPDEQAIDFISVDEFVHLQFPACGSFSKPLPLSSAPNTMNPTDVDVYLWTNSMQKNPLRIECSSSFGRARIREIASSEFHTLFCTDLGAVYSYGNGFDGALGHGHQYTLNRPTLIQAFLSPPIFIQHISCGGGTFGAHSAAIAHDGKLYTWGNGISCGRGTTDRISTPEVVEGSLAKVNCKRVASGGNMCIVLTEDGQLYSWGAWADGRLGQGTIPLVDVRRRRAMRKQVKKFQLHPRKVHSLEDTRIIDIDAGDAHVVALDHRGNLYSWGRGTQGQLGTGSTRNRFKPERIVIPTESISAGPPQFKQVACGSDFSLALDIDGNVWSWGASGSEVLGHGSEFGKPLVDAIISRNQRILGPNAEMPAFDWLRPRVIPTLSNTDAIIHSVSAGHSHAAAVSEAGDLFLWGQNNETPEETPEFLPTLPTLATPSNLPKVGDHAVENVFCGHGQTFAITAGDFLGDSLRQAFRECTEAPLDDDDLSKASQSTQQHMLPTAAYFKRSVACDIAVMASGKVIYAHKVILARRSPILRDMIFTEERPGRAVELMLPELRYDIALLLIEYLYSDNLYVTLDPSTPVPHNLLKAAEKYQLARLAELCKQALFTDEAEDSDDEADQTLVHHEKEEGLRSCLSYDIIGALGDRKWSDITIIAQGKPIYAHRSILSSRSTYFRAMFSHRMLESNIREIKVDEEYVGMLRMMTFIYSNVIRPATDDDLLQDLIAADRYGLRRMKLLCEYMIEITPSNCLNVWAVAHLVQAHRLKQAALVIIVRHLGQLVSTDAYKQLSTEYPQFPNEIYERIRHLNNRMLLMDWNAEAHQEHSRKRESKDILAIQEDIPWKWYIALLCLVVSYSAIAGTAALGKFVPIINIMVLVGIFGSSCLRFSRD